MFTDNIRLKKFLSIQDNQTITATGSYIRIVLYNNDINYLDVDHPKMVVLFIVLASGIISTSRSTDSPDGDSKYNSVNGILGK